MDIPSKWRLAGVMLVVFLFANISGPLLYAQDSTFTVTVEEKDSSHPYTDEGWPDAYAIDGEQDPDLVLERGKTYEFHMKDIGASHPFYMSLSEVGWGQETYDEGVENNYAYGNDTLTFTPSDQTPDTLYYQCENHSYMGNLIEIKGGDTGVADYKELPGKLRLESVEPNPFNPTARIRFHLRESAEVGVEVYDVTGRQVLQLPTQTFTAGTNQSIRVRADELSSGIYQFRLTAEMGRQISVEWGRFTVLK